MGSRFESSETEHSKQVEAYREQWEIYRLYAELLRRVLDRARRFVGAEGFAQARAKAIPSFAEKIIRKQDKYEDPVHDFTDLCGGRVVTCVQSEADSLCRFVRDSFFVDEANSEDTQERLRATEFGYRSIHYVVQMPWIELLGTDVFQPIVECASGGNQVDAYGALHKIGGKDADELIAEVFEAARQKGVDVNEELQAVMPAENARILTEEIEALLDSPLAPGCETVLDVMCLIGNRKAEIQVATMLQYVWAATTHDRLYKGTFDPPDRLKRELYRIAAQLEDSDADFSRALSAFDEYEMDYGSYMTAGQIREEIHRWEIAARYDRENVALALKIAGLAAALEEWDEVIETLEPHADAMRAEVLRELGRAKSRVGHGGRKELEEACELAPDDWLAWSYLGDTYCEESGACSTHDARQKAEKCRDAITYYHRAYRAGPSEPGSLKRYLKCKICSAGHHSFLTLLRPSLERAIRKCQRLASARVHVPQAFYTMGMFNLLFERDYESIDAYAKAVHFSEGTGAIEDALGELDSLRQGIAKADEPPEWADNIPPLARFLELAVVAKALEVERKARERVMRCEKEVKTKEREREAVLELLKGITESGGDEKQAEQESLEKRLEQIDQDLDVARRALQQEKDDLEEAEAESQESRRKFTSREKPDHESLASPVVIVAGGCDARFEQQVQAYRDLMVEAFRGYQGTIVSGGTLAGVSRIVGDVQEAYPESVRTIGYVPGGDLRSFGTERDPRYAEIRRSERPGFSVLGPLETWADIMSSGVDPADVRVLAINGGEIAAAEYRIALALGATVGVLEESGREAARLWTDEEWREAQGLIDLPPEEAIVRSFVNSAAPTVTPAKGEERDKIARQVHEAYREAKKQEMLAQDVSTSSWEDLPEEFRESSRAQLDHAFVKLQLIGCRWRKVEGRPITPIVFSPEEIETMAREEHARYVVERLMRGWRLGPERSVENRTNPSLVPWDELREETKELDRNAVREIPAQLKEAGYEIYRAG